MSAASVTLERSADAALEGTRVLLLGARDAGALEDAGARVEVVGTEELRTRGAGVPDVVILGAMPLDRALVLVRELRADEDVRHVPRVALVAPGDAAAFAAVGGVVVVDEGISDDALVALVFELVPPVAAEKARRVQAEGEVRALTSELEDARRDRASFAHDLRVLLAVAMGFGCNLRDGIVGELSAEQLTNASRIVAAVRDANAMVERFAEGPRAPRAPGEAKRRAPRRARVAAGELAVAVARLFEETARRADITLTVDVREPLVVWCDALQIKQALVNLLVNALKLTPRGGRVAVVVVRAETTEEIGIEARAYVELRVEDSGPGVPEADRERIFERGVRLTRDEVVPGSGIGLAVVKEIAAAHRASAAVRGSSLGGASFVLALPFDLRKREGA